MQTLNDFKSRSSGDSGRTSATIRHKPGHVVELRDAGRSSEDLSIASRSFGGFSRLVEAGYLFANELIEEHKLEVKCDAGC